MRAQGPPQFPLKQLLTPVWLDAKQAKAAVHIDSLSVPRKNSFFVSIEASKNLTLFQLTIPIDGSHHQLHWRPRCKHTHSSATYLRAWNLELGTWNLELAK
jgi:hypothetical protein